MMPHWQRDLMDCSCCTQAALAAILVGSMGLWDPPATGAHCHLWCVWSNPPTALVRPNRRALPPVVQGCRHLTLEGAAELTHKLAGMH